MLAEVLMSLAAAPAAPTLHDVQGLAPEAVGALLLGDKPHRRIVETRHFPQGGMDPPGYSRLELVEAPEALHDGCVRRRWRATFVRGPNDALQDARFQEVHSGEEVAVPVAAGGCAAAHFVGLQPNTDLDGAMRSLRTFDRIAGGGLRVVFVCKTIKGDGLCGSSASTLAGLRSAPPWILSIQAGTAEVWLQDAGGTVTTVRFEGAAPRRVSVVREYPPPF